MEILQALLAFAVTMLGLATIVTLILEVVFRLAKRRGRVLTHMLQIVFETEILPRVRESKVGADASEFAEEIRKSPLGDVGFLPAGLRSFFGIARSEDLSSEEFVQRLARSAWGQALRKEAGDRFETAVDLVVARFDQLSDASREYFKGTSAVLSLMIGVLLALVANVDGYRVLDFYVQNPEVAERVGTEADELLAAQNAAQERLDAARAALEAPPEAGVDPADAAKEQIQQAQDVIATTKDAIGGLAAAGVPVGWAYYPHCWLGSSGGMDGSPDPRCRPRAGAGVGAFALWLVATLVTGFLIGLGGPFWYDAVRGLTRVTQVLRGRGGAPGGGGSDGGGSGGDGAAAPARNRTLFKALTDPAAPTEPANSTHTPAEEEPESG